MLFVVASVRAEPASVDTYVTRLDMEITVEKDGTSISNLTLCQYKCAKLLQIGGIEFQQLVKLVSV